MMFTSDPRKMGEFANPLWLKVVGYAVCTLIAGLNLYLLYQTIGPVWLAVAVAVTLAFSAWVRFIYREPKSASVAAAPAD
jgi:manganese transport protein